MRRDKENHLVGHAGGSVAEDSLLELSGIPKSVNKATKTTPQPIPHTRGQQGRGRGMTKEDRKTYDRQDAAARGQALVGTQRLEVGRVAGHGGRVRAVEVCHAEDVGGTALRVAVAICREESPSQHWSVVRSTGTPKGERVAARGKRGQESLQAAARNVGLTALDDGRGGGDAEEEGDD